MSDDLEGRVDELIELWLEQQSEYPDHTQGASAAAAVRCCAKELRQVLNGADLDELESEHIEVPEY